MTLAALSSRDNGQVAGVVSERDLVWAIGKSGAKVLKEPVSVYMTKTVVTAREADPIDRLMSEMTSHRFRHMPVVEKGRLMGLVSIGDVVKMYIAEADMEAAATMEYAAELVFDQASRPRLIGQVANEREKSEAKS